MGLGKSWTQDLQITSPVSYPLDYGGMIEKQAHFSCIYVCYMQMAGVAEKKCISLKHILALPT